MKHAAVLIVSMLLSACAINASPDRPHHSIGTTLSDPAGDAEPAVDVIAFESNLGENDVVTVTFTLNDLPERLTINREGITEAEEYAWEALFYLSENYDPDRPAYRLGIWRYTSGVGDTRDGNWIAVTDAYLLRSFRDDQQGRDIFFPEDTRIEREIDTDANTMTLLTRIPGISPEWVVLFRAADALSGSDAPEGITINADEFFPRLGIDL